MKMIKIRTVLSLVISVALALLLFGCESSVVSDASSHTDKTDSSDSSADISSVSASETTSAAETSSAATSSAASSTSKTTSKASSKVSSKTPSKASSAAVSSTIATAVIKPPSFSTPLYPQEDISGPEYEGYRLVAEAVKKIQNWKYFNISFYGGYDAYEEGVLVPVADYQGHGHFAPGSPTSVERHMTFFSPDSSSLFMCQHGNDVFYTHLLGRDENRKKIYAKKRFVATAVTENIALTEAAVSELRHLPSARNAVNVEILPSAKYRSVTIPIPAEEFSKLYEYSIRHFAFVVLEPDSTLKYTVRDCQVMYIINEEGYAYQTQLNYIMDVTGTKDGQPYQKTLKIFTYMQLSQLDTYKNEYSSLSCGHLDSTIYEKIDNPGWVYGSALPTLS